jgi:hypothetical protein
MMTSLLKQLLRLQSCSLGSGPYLLLMRAHTTQDAQSGSLIWLGSDLSSPLQQMMTMQLRPIRHGFLRLNHQRKKLEKQPGFDPFLHQLNSPHECWIACLT